MNQAIAAGHFSESFAKRFARGPADSGVGNLQRFLLALDLLTSTLSDVDLGAVDPHTASYMRSFQRREKERKDLAATLQAAGMKVVRIPSLSDDERGLNYLNGLHEPGRYLMPAYGGLYAPLDDRARAAFEGALGPAVDVVPVLCGETQRRGGGVHCAVSVLPRP
jgi:agmatine/peptidylarginine deiminase